MHFQLRGRENLRNFKQNIFKFDVSDDGREYAYIHTTMLQKNIKASVKRKQFENLKEVKMVLQPDNDMCPVKRLKQYLQMLPCTNDNCLFRLLKKTVVFDSSREGQTREFYENFE